MKKKIIYNKKTKRINMVLKSTGNIIVDTKIFSKKVVDLTTEEFKELSGSNATYYKNGKFEFKPIRKKKKIINDIKDKIENATSLSEVKDEIIKLLNII